MFGRSKWCRILALDPFSWRVKENVDSSACDTDLCVLSDTVTRKATASLASGNGRERAASRVGSGRLRENAVPRHRQTTCPLSISLHFAKHVENVFLSLRCILDESTFPHIDAGTEKSSRRSSPLSLASINMSRASPSSLLQSTHGFYQAPLSAMSVQTCDVGQEIPIFASIFKKSTVRRRELLSLCFRCIFESHLPSSSWKVNAVRALEAAGTETGMDETFWTLTVRSPTASLNIDKQSIPWSKQITYVGSTMQNRLQKATGVFEKWSNILCDTTLNLTRFCFKASVLSSLSSSWILTKQQLSHLSSWGARLHARMLGTRRGATERLVPSGCDCTERDTST